MVEVNEQVACLGEGAVWEWRHLLTLGVRGSGEAKGGYLNREGVWSLAVAVGLLPAQVSV